MLAGALHCRLSRERGATSAGLRAGALCVQGIGAFYKGFVPNFGRLGSWNVIMFLTLEQVRIAASQQGYAHQCIGVHGVMGEETNGRVL